MSAAAGRRRSLFAALLVVQALALAFAVGGWWGQRQSTLFHNGGWTLGKGSGKFVFYTFEFLFRPLERGEVNLASDMGFQEILSTRPEGPGRRLESLACTARIAPAGYLWLEVGKSGRELLGFRLSRRTDYASGFHRFDREGEPRAVTPVSVSGLLNDLGVGDRVELRREAGRWAAAVNGRPLGQVADDLPAAGTFGFRGSGDPGLPVVVRDVEMRFTDPATGRSWTERESFRARTGDPRTLLAALGFALAVLLLRRWRRALAGRLLAPDGRERLVLADETGTTILLALLAAGIALRPAGGTLIPLALLAAELVFLVALALGSRGEPPEPRPGLGRAGALFGAAVALLAAAALARHGDLLGWGRYSTWGRLKSVHPDAFVLRPGASSSSPRFATTAPLTVLPGEPFFAGGGAWRSQLIRLEFVPPPAGTLDLVFQQQSFLTLGDPQGEELPVQRRLLRLSTRPDVPSGLASGTHKAPSPFARLEGALLPGAANRLEVRSDDRGVEVVLNGARSRFPGARPLGHGETGVIAWDGPVQVAALSVEATAGQGFRDRLLPLAGLLLPFAAAGALWAVLRAGGRVPLATVAALAPGGVAPLAAYLAAALLLDRNTLLLLHRERTAWLDLALLAAALALPALVLFVRRRLRGAVAFFYLACGVVTLAGLWLAVDRIATVRPELLRRWLPADDVVVPGELVEQGKTGSGPWYSQDRMVGASNYVWRQLLGTRRATAAKPPGTQRVFLMGGSQAWGSGAADSSSTFDQLLERRLAARGLPVEVFNAGINGAGISRVRWTWDGLVSGLAPDLLILDVGLNDSAALATAPGGAERGRRRDALLAEFRAVLDRADALGAGVLLVLEPMCQETPLRPDADFYAGLARIAGERGVPVVSPQGEFARLERDRFLWWDTAHLTPYGHDAMARLLEEPVTKIVEGRLAAGAP